MASQGPYDGVTFADDDSVGTAEWQYPSYAQTSNDIRTYVVLSDYAAISHYLTAVDFDSFNIPADAIVDGIVVEYERSALNLISIKDIGVRLILDGVISGDNKASTSYWPVVDTYQTYGGSSDKWGLTPTYDQINAADFGVAIAVINLYPASRIARIDHVRITVYYTSTTAPEIQMQSLERSLKGVLRGVNRGV